MTSKKSSEENSIKAVIICGPTGSGKSSLALRLAEHFNGQIISADSRQIYRRLDIGTAKPTKQDQAKVKHHMIDIADITEDFTAKRYAEMASTALIEIARSGVLPFIVGGAGLYLKALTEGFFQGPEKDSSIRKQLEEIASKKGLEILYRELSQIDPESAKRITSNDSVRIIRALEVYRLTGRPISYLQANGKYSPVEANYLWLGISHARPELYHRIDIRVDQMVRDGLVDEISDLVRDGLRSPILKKRIVGYYEVIEAMDKKLPLEKAISLVKQNSRNYAKRQLTWYRNKARVTWIKPDHFDGSDESISLIKEHCGKMA